MRHRPGPVRALIAAAALPVLAGNAAPPVPSVPLQDVSVTVTGVRNARGVVTACLTANPKTFPNCKADRAARTLSVPAAVGTVTLDFGPVVPGHYAVSFFHDENANGKLDTALLIPREGYGFSRDAKVRLGPPRFASASFAVDGHLTHLAAKMRYLF